MSYDQNALDAASMEVHLHLLREGSSWGTKACEEMGRIFMTAYLKAAPRPEAMTREKAEEIISKGGHGYLDWQPGDDTAIVDGHFTPDELEAVAFLLRLDKTQPQRGAAASNKESK